MRNEIYIDATKGFDIGVENWDHHPELTIKVKGINIMIESKEHLIEQAIEGLIEELKFIRGKNKC